MKQRITVEQLNELTEEQKQRLREWWQPEDGDYFVRTFPLSAPKVEVIAVVNLSYDGKPYCDIGASWAPLEKLKAECTPLLSIGRCIKLLQDKVKIGGEFGIKLIADHKWRINFSELWILDKEPLDVCNDEPIDALWDAVKEVL